jgi:hypothetical protein
MKTVRRHRRSITMRIVFGVLLCSFLVIISALCLVSYLTPVGLTLSGDDQGHYAGLRWENGWFIMIKTTVFPTSATYVRSSHYRWWVVEAGIGSEPWGFTSHRVRNQIGSQLEETYEGWSAGPYQTEFRRIVLGIHWAIPMAGSLWVFVVIFRPLFITWIRKRKGLCITCGYDSRGNQSNLCPECGSPSKISETSIFVGADQAGHEF